MALIFDFSDTYTWPVGFDFPVSGGRHRRVTFEAEFKRMEQDDLERLMEPISNAPRDSVEQVRALRDLAGEILVGWSDVKDADGEEFPYSETAKAKLLNVAGMANVIVEAYSGSIAKERGKP